MPSLGYKYLTTRFYLVSVTGKFVLGVHEVREVDPICYIALGCDSYWVPSGCTVAETARMEEL